MANLNYIGQSIQEITDNAKQEQFTGVIVLNLSFCKGGLRRVDYFEQKRLTIVKKFDKGQDIEV